MAGNGVYVPRILARSLTPVDWGGYLTQQRRWARSISGVSNFGSITRLIGGLPFKTRIMSFLHDAIICTEPPHLRRAHSAVFQLLSNGDLHRA